MVPDLLIAKIDLDKIWSFILSSEITSIFLISYLEIKFKDDDLKLIDEKAKKIIKEFNDNLANIDNLNRENLEPIVNKLISNYETNFKGIGQPLRVALTGSKFGPGLYDILISLGKEEVKKRLESKIVI